MAARSPERTERLGKDIQDGKDKYYPEISQNLIEYTNKAIDLKRALKHTSDYAFDHPPALQQLYEAVTNYKNARNLLDQQHLNYEKYILDYWQSDSLKKELQQAVEKYRQLYPGNDNDFSAKIMKLVQEMNVSKYKERLLIKRGQQLSYLKTESMAYCYADGKLCYAVDFNSNKYLLETNLSQLEEQLHPAKFFRINRNLLVNIESIIKVHSWLGGRLKLELSLVSHAETIVSRERVNGFKNWLGR